MKDDTKFRLENDTIAAIHMKLIVIAVIDIWILIVFRNYSVNVRNLELLLFSM
jgi:hypothetical protein